MHDGVERHIDTAAPVHVVWAAITDPAQVGQWLGDSASIDLRVGGALRFTWPAGELASGEVIAVDPPRRFAFRWDVFGTLTDPETFTTVEFTLSERESGVRVHVRETGLRAVMATGRAISLPDVVAEHGDGWRNELRDLARHVTGRHTLPLDVPLDRPLDRPTARPTEIRLDAATDPAQSRLTAGAAPPDAGRRSAPEPP